MSDMIVVNAVSREAGTSNEARRLRREGKLPAVVYGGGQDSFAVTLEPRDLLKILKSDSGQNTVFEVKIGDEGAAETVMVFDYQVDPIRHQLTHADLVRISMDKAIEVSVQLVFTGVPKGVEMDGGVLDQAMREVTVECMPTDIPEGLVVDVSELEIGDSVRVEDIVVPSSVRVLVDEDTTLASVVPPVSEEDLEVAVEEVPFGEEVEPELVGEGEEGEAEPDAKPEKEEAGDKE
jgi:large subunit ribosomal protein L25